MVVRIRMYEYCYSNLGASYADVLWLNCILTYGKNAYVMIVRTHPKMDTPQPT